MATSRATLASVFATIQGTANTLTAAVGAVNDVVNMGNRAIDDAARRQKVRSEADLVTYEETYLTEKTREITEVQDSVEEWCNEKEGRADRFESNLASLREKIALVRKQRK